MPPMNRISDRAVATGATIDAGAPVGAGDLRAIAEKRLRRMNQRLTAGRTMLLDALSGADRPLTIPEILAGRSRLAQSSVYRNLVVLEAAGIVHRVVTRDEFARYELAEDLTGHHHHLVCEGCGLVVDLPATPALERAVSSAVAQAHRRHGFRAAEHRLDLIGRCADCA
jgi:Fe2+ or Zn2+ uptake regulation protein